MLPDTEDGVVRDEDGVITEEDSGARREDDTTSGTTGSRIFGAANGRTR